ncbi:MAG: CoA-binding protein [Candidatus Hadarchaeales archaeon]
MVSFQELDAFFHPKAVAVIGASTGLDHFVLPMLEAGGKVYLVNPNRKELFGQKCYSSLAEVEEPVDYALVAVPAQLVPGVIRECVEKGVKVVHIFSSGFGEVGRRDLEEEVLRAAGGKVRIIGPNCMGLYCPESFLRFAYHQPSEAGEVGFISQSGGQAVNFVYAGVVRGFRFSKVVSYGNGVDLDAVDFLRYLGEDPKTRAIGMYLEGLRPGRGRELREVMEEVCLRKPVVVLKGGRTEEGRRAVSSHTGSLAGSGRVWEGFLEQVGAMEVGSFGEMADLLAALLRSPLPRGRGVAVTTVSGGTSVVETDGLVEEGLSVPRLEGGWGALEEKLRRAGTSLSNPLDIWPAYARGYLDEVLEVLASQGVIHSIVVEMQAEEFRAYRETPPEWLKDFVSKLARMGRRIQEERGKPVLVAVPPSFFHDTEEAMRKWFQEGGLAVCGSVREAGRILSKMYGYRKYLERKGVLREKEEEGG